MPALIPLRKMTTAERPTSLPLPVGGDERTVDAQCAQVARPQRPNAAAEANRGVRCSVVIARRGSVML
jgi:hypothetical protein